jgi:D-glycero-alpha-D-manno-heptose-7-phosphate kinase
MQDQFAAAFGGFNFIRFETLDRVSVEPVQVADAVLQELRYRSFLISTGKTRVSAHILERQIGAIQDTRSPARDLTIEIRDLAYAARDALEAGDLDEFACLTGLGWQLKRRVDHAITNPEIDGLCDGLLAHGARAVKLLGAGGGGYVLAISRDDGRAALQAYVESIGGQAETFDYEPHGARAWRAAGAEEAAGVGLAA